ncbi:hypothetical protein BDQ17DRAFT_1539999 [Cyathus striatus]|nr:hypothetical protein BDQ17DRAFT_1539999 [Cyathus striatus]
MYLRFPKENPTGWDPGGNVGSRKPKAGTCQEQTRSIDHYDNDITPAKIYDIDQLEVMRLADLAWHEVDASTIHNCWHKSGILPDILPASACIPSVPVTSLLHTESCNDIVMVEAELESTLTELESQGVLSKNNHMGIQELLNPQYEDGVGEGLSANEEYVLEEIVDAVHKKQEAQEMLEINGGDDVDGEMDEVVPRPTCKEALTASMLLQQYMLDVNDPDV